MDCVSSKFSSVIAAAVAFYKKCAGVSGSMSFGDDDISHNGRESTAASTCVKNVVISSKVNFVSPISRLMCVFIVLTPASTNPLKCGDPGGEKGHILPFCASSLATKSSYSFVIFSPNSLNSLFAPQKLVPLSLYKFFTSPLYFQVVYLLVFLFLLFGCAANDIFSNRFRQTFDIAILFKKKCC